MIFLIKTSGRIQLKSAPASLMNASIITAHNYETCESGTVKSAHGGLSLLANTCVLLLH